jgi:hypothetical protein
MKNAFVDANGVLTSWGYAESNNDDTLVEVDDDFAMTPGAAQYKDGVWSDYSAPVDHTGDNTATRDSLMATANAATYGMSDAYVAGLLDDADTATFKAWAKYKLALSKVDLTLASPQWPQAPQV